MGRQTKAYEIGQKGCTKLCESMDQKNSMSDCCWCVSTESVQDQNMKGADDGVGDVFFWKELHSAIPVTGSRWKRAAFIKVC